MTNATIDQPAARHDPATDGSTDPTQDSPCRNTLHLRHDNRLRPVSWRWQRARLLYESCVAPAERWDDEHVDTALQYLRACTERPSALDVLLPAGIGDAIQQAHEVWEANRTRRWMLEAWLLTGEPMDVIADKLLLPVEVVTWYERLFFDTHGRLQIPSFIIHAAVGREIHRPTRQAVGAIWRLFGYRLGPHVLEAVIEDFMAVGRPDYSYLFEPAAEADDMSLERRMLQQAIRMLILPVEDFRKILVHVLNDRHVASRKSTWEGLMEQLAAPESWRWYAATGSENEKPTENVGHVPTDGSHAAEAA